MKHRLVKAVTGELFGHGKIFHFAPAVNDSAPKVARPYQSVFGATPKIMRYATGATASVMLSQVRRYL